jgi:hypothetical protein
MRWACCAEVKCASNPGNGFVLPERPMLASDRRGWLTAASTKRASAEACAKWATARRAQGMHLKPGTCVLEIDFDPTGEFPANREFNREF